MSENPAKTRLYVAYTEKASPPRWLEAAPNDRAHREMEAFRPPLAARAPRCQLAAALKAEVGS